MNTRLEKALAVLAALRGTSIEVEIERYNADIIDRQARMRMPPALNDEERAARARASQLKSLAKAKEARAAARALMPVPTAEEIAAKRFAQKAARKISARRHRVKVRDARRAQRALRKLHGLGPLPLQSPTIAEAQRRISRHLAPFAVLGLTILP